MTNPDPGPPTAEDGPSWVDWHQLERETHPRPPKVQDGHE